MRGKEGGIMRKRGGRGMRWKNKEKVTRKENGSWKRKQRGRDERAKKIKIIMESGKH